MTDTPENTPQSAQQAAQGDPAMNGAEPPAGTMLVDLVREVTLTGRTLEEMNMRLATLQIEFLLLAGLLALSGVGLVLVLRRGRAE